MGLVNDIKQTVKFEDKRDEVIVNIRYTNNYIHTKCQAIYKKHDITHQQYNILRILKGSNGALTSAEIKSRMIEKKADVSRLIDRLIVKKLVSKATSKSDLRKIDVTITKKGINKIAEFTKITSEEMRQCINLTSSEMATLSNLLDKLRNSSAED